MPIRVEGSQEFISPTPGNQRKLSHADKTTQKIGQSFTQGVISKEWYGIDLSKQKIHKKSSSRISDSGLSPIKNHKLKPLNKLINAAEANKKVLNSTNFFEITPSRDIHDKFDLMCHEIESENLSLDKESVRKLAQEQLGGLRFKCTELVKEFYTSEKSYCSGLQHLIQRLETQKVKLPKDEIATKVAKKIDLIIHHVSLLHSRSEEMRDLFAQAIDASDVSDGKNPDSFFSGLNMRKVAEGLSLMKGLAEPMAEFNALHSDYEQFFRDLTAGAFKGSKALDEWIEGKGGFREEWVKGKGPDKMVVYGGSELISPVQRGPRYMLLTGELAKVASSLQQWNTGAKALCEYCNTKVSLAQEEGKFASDVSQRRHTV